MIVKKWKAHGRRKPYTEIGIRRLPCVRCGEQATQQFKMCADNHLWRPVCSECDVKLNEIVLDFLRIPERYTKMKAYIRKMLHGI